jgi:hypothetical protein
VPQLFASSGVESGPSCAPAALATSSDPGEIARALLARVERRDHPVRAMTAARDHRTVGASRHRARHEARHEGEAMTQQYEAPAAQTTPRPDREAEWVAERSVGWVVFAAVVLATGGLLNGIYGIAAIASSRFYAGGVTYVVGDLKTLGWIALALGAAELAASLGLLAFVGWARWLGAGVAGLNAILQLLLMPGAPFLALALLAVNVLVVYALVAHGREWHDA